MSKKQKKYKREGLRKSTHEALKLMHV